MKDAYNTKTFQLYPRERVMERLFENLPRKNDENQVNI